jgi:hypothetical protein
VLVGGGGGEGWGGGAGWGWGLGFFRVEAARANESLSLFMSAV